MNDDSQPKMPEMPTAPTFPSGLASATTREATTNARQQVGTHCALSA